MPTPLGHAMAAVAAGWTVAGRARGRRALMIQIATFAALGTAADLDLLWGEHRAQSHSLGVAAIVATLIAVARWPVAGERWRIGLAACAAWATHPLLDALVLDTRAPIGIMAFWPLSSAYVQTGWEVFAPVSRVVSSPTFVPTAMIAIKRELLILLPVLAIVWFWRARPPRV